MRFPLSLSLATGRWIARKSREARALRRAAEAGDSEAAAKLKIAERFPTTLMLEPSHRCNLRCRGCGRVREYRETANLNMPLDVALAAVDECGAPIVSVCGGEPLIYPEIVALLVGIVERGKFIYLCTNGLALSEFLPRLAAGVDRKRSALLKSRLYWSVHLDGPRPICDALAGRPGTFDAALRGIADAKRAGFRVYTNTTIYRTTSVDDLVELSETLRALKIDGTMLSPAFRFGIVEEEARNARATGGRGAGDLPLVDRSNVGSNVDSNDSGALNGNGSTGSGADVDAGADASFLSRDEIVAYFRAAWPRLRKYRLTATPTFADFLRGATTLPCAAWGNPTFNVRGWRAPCYMIADRHCSTYRELLETTDWTRIGPGRDPRCRDCMTHCGFEPASVLAPKRWFDWVRLAVWYCSK